MKEVVFTAAVITISDRSFKGEREDTAGPLVREMMEAAGYDVVYSIIVPDDIEMIKSELSRCADTQDIALIITTGGTGFSPRDITPEATAEVCDRMAPGIPEAMRMASLRKIDRAMLSRGTAGIRGRSLIVNLPGSPKAAEENFEAVIATLAHGLEMLRGGPADCTKLPNTF